VRKLRKSLIATAVFTAVLVPSAIAAPHAPKGEFKAFSYCPLDRKTITDCVYSITNGGSVAIGDSAVPIGKPLILQGGFEEGDEEGELQFLGAEGGETLSKTAQPVPGGLAGVPAPASWPKSLQEWFENQIEGSAGQVTATIELAAPATSIELSTQNLLNQEGTALGLPVKIKLANPLLGGNCYIGSDSNPIQIDLSTGKSGATEGSPGLVNFNKAYTRVTLNNGRLVNGTFAAPKASGCGGLLSFFIDPLVDSVLGLPSESGENTAIFAGAYQSGNAAAVRKSE
jgi:hypothetical protein